LKGHFHVSHACKRSLELRCVLCESRNSVGSLEVGQHTNTVLPLGVLVMMPDPRLESVVLFLTTEWCHVEEIVRIEEEIQAALVG
jgi:hypothetical protein